MNVTYLKELISSDLVKDLEGADFKDIMELDEIFQSIDIYKVPRPLLTFHNSKAIMDKLVMKFNEDPSRILEISFLISLCFCQFFTEFVDDVLIPLLISGSQMECLLAIAVCFWIFPPNTGFLQSSAHFAKLDSPILYGISDLEHQHPFVQSYYRLSSKVIQVFENSIQSVFNNPSSDPYKEVNCNSLFSLIEVPQIHKNSISSCETCGFPFRFDFLVSIYNILSKTHFLNKTFYPPYVISPITRKWLDFYQLSSNFIPEFDTLIFSCLDFSKTFEKVTESYSFLAYLMKVVIFLPNIKELSNDIFKYIFRIMFSLDGDFAAFTINWCQILMIFSSKSISGLFDELLNQLSKLHEFSFPKMNSIGKITYYFCETLCKISGSFLSDKQILQLNSYSALFLCSPMFAIRQTGYDIAKILDHFAFQSEGHSFYRLMDKNMDKVEHHFIRLFKILPIIHNASDPFTFMPILHFQEALTCRYPILWENFIISIFFKSILPYASIHLRYTMINTTLTFLNNTSNISETDCFSHNIVLFRINCLCQLLSLVQETSSKTSEIVNIFFVSVNQYSNQYSSAIREMCHSISVFLLPIITSRLNDIEKPEAIALIMRSISSNDEFLPLCAEPYFRERFLNNFINLLKLFDGENKIDKKYSTPISPEITQFILDHIQFIIDSITAFYHILSYFPLHFSETKQTSYPTCEFIIPNDDVLVNKIRCFFPQLLFTASIPQTSSLLKSIHRYATESLNLWLKFCDEPINLTPQLIETIASFSADTPEILTSLLCHRLSSLLPIYLSRSMEIDGEPFFDALCLFFYTPNDFKNSSDPVQSLIDRLKSIADKSSSKDNKVLEVLYEESGNIIAASLLYLSLTNNKRRMKAAQFLIVLGPILLILHQGQNVRTDLIAALIMDFSDIFNESVTTTNGSDVAEIIGDTFQYCIEEILYALFGAFKSLNSILALRLFYTMKPLLDSIPIDLENRVISPGSDITFMRFSCFSYVEALFNAFSQYINIGENSEFLPIFSDIANKTSYDFVLLALFKIVSTQHHFHAIIATIQYLYVIDPESVLFFLSNHVSFLHFLNDQINLPWPPILSSESMISSISIDDLTNNMSGLNSNNPSTSDDESITSNQIQTSQSNFIISESQIDSPDLIELKFILKTINILIQTNIQPILPYLSYFFVACILDLKNTNSLLKTILISLENELSDPPLVLREMKILYDSNPEDIPKFLYLFLHELDPKYSEAFGLEILRWALCCGDIIKATIACHTFCSVLHPLNNTVISLFAKSFWICGSALSTANLDLQFGKESFNSYIQFIASNLVAVNSIAKTAIDEGNIGLYPALFWIPGQFILCNDHIGLLFHTAEQSLLTFFDKPQIFSYIASDQISKIPEDNSMFSYKVFWKYYHPWGEKFEGFIDPLLDFNGDNFDVNLTIRLINKMIQTRSKYIIGNLEEAFLAILPWMLFVFSSESFNSTFLSENMNLLSKTIDSLAIIMPGLQAIIELERILTSPVDDIQSIFIRVAQNLVQLPVKLNLIEKFYARIMCDEKVDKSIITTVKIISKAISSYHNTFLSEEKLTTYFAKNKKQKTQEPFLEHLDERISGFSQDFENLEEEESTYESEEINEANLSNDDLQNSNNRINFPQLAILERIVVVEIPHLYELSSLPETRVTCGELNSFISPYYYDPIFSQSELVETIRTALQSGIYEPFDLWADIYPKGNTFLADQGYVVKMKISGEIHIKENIDKVLGIRNEQLNQEAIEADEIKKAEEEEEEEPLPPSDEMFILDTSAFIPTIEIVNETGQELFDQINEKEDF